MHRRGTARAAGLVLCLLSVGFAQSKKPTAAPLPTTKPATTQPRPAKRIEVSFSPNGGCTGAIIHEIDAAKKRIRIQAHLFTYVPIVKALTAAKERGVDITAILDRTNATSRSSAAGILSNAGVTVLIDAAHGVAHSKIILIDDDTVITGSFDFTDSSESSNAENLLVIAGLAGLYTEYDKNFSEHLAHSKPFRVPAGVEKQPSPESSVAQQQMAIYQDMERTYQAIVAKAKSSPSDVEWARFARATSDDIRSYRNRLGTAHVLAQFSLGTACGHLGLMLAEVADRFMGGSSPEGFADQQQMFTEMMQMAKETLDSAVK